MRRLAVWSFPENAGSGQLHTVFDVVADSPKAHGMNTPSTISVSIVSLLAEERQHHAAAGRVSIRRQDLFIATPRRADPGRRLPLVGLISAGVVARRVAPGDRSASARALREGYTCRPRHIGEG
jgi:hypothetical protein